MSSDRVLSGYLWGDGILEYANIDHYRRAHDENRITDEEYWAQSVFHGPSHAANLTKEIFQKRIRNNCKIYESFNDIVHTDDEKVRQQVRSEEAVNGQTSTMVASVVNLNYSDLSPDKSTRFYRLVLEILKNLDDDEYRVFAFILVREGLDVVLEKFFGQPDVAKLESLIREVWGLENFMTESLNKFVGTRYRSDKARYTLAEKFQGLLDIIDLRG